MRKNEVILHQYWSHRHMPTSMTSNLVDLVEVNRVEVAMAAANLVDGDLPTQHLPRGKNKMKARGTCERQRGTVCTVQQGGGKAARMWLRSAPSANERYLRRRCLL